MGELKVGDTIKCCNVEDTIITMTHLANLGIETNFDYTDGVRLIVTEIKKKEAKKSE